MPYAGLKRAARGKLATNQGRGGEVPPRRVGTIRESAAKPRTTEVPGEVLPEVRAAGYFGLTGRLSTSSKIVGHCGRGYDESD